MSIFSWEDSLSIGIQNIDNQHRELIRRLDDLAQHIQKRKGKEKIASMLRFMSDYGEKHFLEEEEFMTKNNFPGLAEQRKHHENFRKTTKRLLSELESQEDMESFASAVQRYLIDWLILHIKTEDRKLGEFVGQD